MPSVIGIIICMICLAGATWAWFSSDVQIKPQTIKAASFDVLVSISAAEGEEIVSSEKNSYLLAANTVYSVNLTVDGDASTGYCVIQFGDTKYFTGPISNTQQTGQPAEFTFTLIPQEDGEYTFIGVWGTYSGAPDIENQGTLGELRPEAQDESSADQMDPPAGIDSNQPGIVSATQAADIEVSASEPAVMPTDDSSEPEVSVVESKASEAEDTLDTTSNLLEQPATESIVESEPLVEELEPPTTADDEASKLPVSAESS